MGSSKNGGLVVGLLVGHKAGPTCIVMPSSSYRLRSSCKYLLLSIFGFRAVRTLVVGYVCLLLLLCVLFSSRIQLPPYYDGWYGFGFDIQ